MKKTLWSRISRTGIWVVPWSVSQFSHGQQVEQQAPPLARPVELTLGTSHQATNARLEFATLLDQGNLRESREVFLASFDMLEDDAERVDLSLQYANTLAKTATTKSDIAFLDEAEEHYQFVIDHGSSRERLMAANNHATAVLRFGNGEAAVSLFEKNYEQAKSSGEGKALARYLYNYGDALADQGYYERAVALFAESYDAHREDVRAAEAGLDTAVRGSDVSAAADFVDGLVARGHLPAGESALRRLLSARNLAGKDDFAKVITALYRYLLAANTDEGKYYKHWHDDLTKTGQRLSGMAHNYAAMIPIAYGDLEVTVDPNQARNEFTPWAPLDSRDAAAVLAEPAAFLAGVGEIYAREGRISQALARYTLGWALDNSNVKAGQYAANLMIEYRADLDPDGTLLDEFVFHLFEGKGEAYLGEDWPAIFRFHSILASIYVQDREWGDSWYPRSAIFQLEHALQARERIGNPTVRESAVPGLYAMLGQAYAGVGRNADAFDSFLQAAEDALRIDDIESAKDHLEAASNLSYSPDSEQGETFDRLKAATG